MSPRVTTLAGFFASAGLFFGAAIPAQAVTTWNWSFSYDSNTFGSGTFTSADLVPIANTDILVTGITGTVTVVGVPSTITSLNFSKNNIFRWDGTGTSPLILFDSYDVFSSGVSFTDANGSYFVSYDGLDRAC